MPSPSQNDPLANLGIGAPPSATPPSKKLGVVKGYQPPIAGLTALDPNSPVLGADLPIFPSNPIGSLYDQQSALGYTKADVMGPASDLNGIPSIQAEMVQAGLLAKGSVRLGVWDTASQDAYARVLDFATKNAMNVQDAITYLVANPPLKLTKAGGTLSAVGQTSPVDINQTFQNEAQQLTGQQQQAPSSFVSQYQGQQIAAQHSRGAVYTAPPTVANAADQYLQTQDPASVQAYGAASRMLEIENMLGQK